MKLIKSFFFVAICLCSSLVLHAQNAKNEPAKDVKKEVDKQAEAKQPQPPAPVLAPSTTPEFNPQPGSATPKEAPKVPASSPVGNENDVKSKPAEQTKVDLLTYDPAKDKKTLTPEQQNILNGKKERPKERVAATPNTSRPDATMPPLPKPVEQQ